jgi:hypothetical protein
MTPLPAARSMPQPVLILDKSAFQAMSRTEQAERLFRYQENITPILLREIHADLAKADPGKSPDAVVQILATKFLGSGGVINANLVGGLHETVTHPPVRYRVGAFRNA